jgi:hypothetical protein
MNGISVNVPVLFFSLSLTTEVVQMPKFIILEDSHLHTRRRENLKSRFIILLLLCNNMTVKNKGALCWCALHLTCR